MSDTSEPRVVAFAGGEGGARLANGLAAALAPGRPAGQQRLARECLELADMLSAG